MSAEESLLHTKRIYVDTFGEDAVSKQIQAMVVSQLTESSRFIVTENKDKADASLKGAGLEKTSQEFHSYNSATAAGSHSGAVDGSWSGGTGSITGYSHGAAAAIQDSNASTETINEARVAVRLVNRDGDVIWATTEESKGAKYKGASADVAEMVVKQLLHDVEKAQRKKETTAATNPAQ